MRPVAFVLPLQPGKEERWRRFLQQLNGSRREEYGAMRRRLGIRDERVWLQRKTFGTMAVLHLEVEDPDGLVSRLAASREPFEVWLKERLEEFHGVDFSSPHAGWAPRFVFAGSETGVPKGVPNEGLRGE